MQPHGFVCYRSGKGAGEKCGKILRKTKIGDVPVPCDLTYRAQQYKLLGYGYIHDIQTTQQKKEAQARLPFADEFSRRAPGDYPEKGQGPQAPFGLGASASMASPVKLLLLGMLRAYRYALSPLLPPSCRFEPSCSAYCEEAVERYGALKGGRLGLMRLLRCHPFHPGGYDPVK